MSQHAPPQKPTHYRRVSLGAVAAAAVSAALLLPLNSGAESSLQSGSRTAHPGASARVDFKIVIPPLLGLSIDAAGGREGRDITAAVQSNGQQVLLSATAAESAATPGSHGLLEREAIARHTLLSARRGATISSVRACELGASTAVAGSYGAVMVLDRRAIVCTVATP